MGVGGRLNAIVGWASMACVSISAVALGCRESAGILMVFSLLMVAICWVLISSMALAEAVAASVVEAAVCSLALASGFGGTAAPGTVFSGNCDCDLG